MSAMAHDLHHDVDMSDGSDVRESTEIRALPGALAAPTQSGLGYDTGPSLTPGLQPSSAPVLKGTGLRRELGASISGPVIRKDNPKPPKFASLPYATSQTGLVYDVRMRFHVEAEPSDDDLHPEDPRRIYVIYEAFVNAGLAWREGDSGPSTDFYMGRIDARMVTRDEVCLVHTYRHWAWVQSLERKVLEELKNERQHPEHANDSVYLSTSTPYCASLSAGGAIEACRAIILGKVKNVFAVIRPPGHHAEREDAKGFCFYDNVSIALKACQREFGDRCRKVFVLDWDVHHGNGIQQANYDDPNVLYISLHVHNRGNFYPESSYRDNRIGYGNYLHCGEGAGLGKNVNIPWSQQGMGDADYIYAFQQIVMPIATEFDPDLVIIAAGFDAAEGDMLGKCHVTPAGYAHMTHMLMSLAEGRVAVCLEGGYNLESIARSSCAVGRTLMGEPPDRLENVTPSRGGVLDVERVLRQQSKFWSCLHAKSVSAGLASTSHAVRMHNIVREWQAETLYNEHAMVPLFVHRQRLAKEFENQVLATPNYREARPLMVVLHDPPEALAERDPWTGKFELHNTWLTDVVKSYVDWAAKQGFAVIDVNLPRHTAALDADRTEYAEPDDVDDRIKDATQLLTYLWENYIELHESTHIFLMGTNTGHGAIVNFIKTHDDRAQQMITSAISFVEDVPLKLCKSTTNDRLSSWYYKHSMVFIASDHNYCQQELSRKPRKYCGQVSQSRHNSISDMLVEHRQAVLDHWLAAIADWKDEKSESDDGDMKTGMGSGFASPSRLPPISNFALSPTKIPSVSHPSRLTHSPHTTTVVSRSPPNTSLASGS